jgi:hypothetical protein
MKAYYARNPEKMRASAKASRERNIEYYRAYDRARGFREYDPAKTRARRAANHYLPDAQPCEECGSEGERHHDDYSQPLDVRWLCREHHAIEHRVHA